MNFPKARWRQTLRFTHQTLFDTDRESLPGVAWFYLRSLLPAHVALIEIENARLRHRSSTIARPLGLTHEYI